MKLRTIIDEIKDRVFPHFCVECRRENEWWCQKCRGEVKPFKIRADGALNSATALFNYSNNSAISKLIHDFKYNYATDIEALWTEVIKEAGLDFDEDTVLIPVPLHPRRERERGFNQSEKIGRSCAAAYGLQVGTGLRRIKNTIQQMKLSREERLNNVKGAFRWDPGAKAPKRILLVDDVYTTGATMEECAVELKRVGAEFVEGLVLAHG